MTYFVYDFFDFQTKVLDVKMEHSLYFNDNNDDFSDADFNFPLSNNPDESSKTGKYVLYF